MLENIKYVLPEFLVFVVAIVFYLYQKRQNKDTTLILKEKIKNNEEY